MCMCEQENHEINILRTNINKVNTRFNTRLGKSYVVKFYGANYCITSLKSYLPS